ncbi:hypothetical protein H0H92_015379 [Tricholoma furcatifolium]|nr:hypothetical protein H0H92_015379 [Tricholoma furcatifolium]
MVSALHYTISAKSRLNWNAAQEKSISNDYPFAMGDETDEDYVARVYLQFLWLPESIMPLNLLVPSLQRVSSDPSQPHPLHNHLKPLLQTARTASRKYHVELPNILSNGGGAGEIEETMMWYALSYEKADEDLWTRTHNIREGPWEDEKWRARWLERMERREFQIQILLYFLKLSVSGPLPPPSSPNKKEGGRGHGKINLEPSPEDCLEIFMDKLSMWQLMGGLEDSAEAGPSKAKPLDWMQTFFEDIVKPQFGKQLPEMCTLMRSKVFPNSPFSDSSAPSSPASPRATSPDDLQPPARESTRYASPALSTTSSKAPQTLVRNRSRSLSISLAQERIERERSVTAGASKKRVLNREVSMSRAFKPKAKPAQEEAPKKKAPNEANVKKEAKSRDEGVLLVEATPTKPKLGRSQSSLSFRNHSQSQVFLPLASIGGDEDDDEWRLPGSNSPDVLLLGPGRYDEDGDINERVADHTPTKRSRLR